MIERTVPNANPVQLESEIRAVGITPCSVYLTDGGSYVLINRDTTQEEADSVDTVISNHVPKYPFNPEQAITEFYASLSDQMFNNNVDFGKIGFMVQWQNFQGLKLYANGLLAYGFITQDVYDRYKQIFLNQNINLDDY